MRTGSLQSFLLMHIIIGFYLLLLSAPTNAANLSGRVIRVMDGDHLVVLDTNNVQYRVRLLGIDAPELKQAYGYRARDNLSVMVSGRFVLVDFDPASSTDEIPAKVLLNGLNINLQQIQAGLAWYDRQNETAQENPDFKQYQKKEAEARLAKRGLWFNPDPKPPWVFRQGK